MMISSCVELTFFCCFFGEGFVGYFFIVEVVGEHLIQVLTVMCKYMKSEFTFPEEN